MDTEDFSRFLKLRSQVSRRLGPFRGLTVAERETERNLLRQLDLIRDVHVTHTATGRRDCYAPSPFHAAVLLLALQETATQSESTTDGMPDGPLVFRGQSDAEWPLMTTLCREHGPSAAPARESVLFARAMSEFGELALQTNLSEQCYMAISQHYGLPTDLLDFTPDPEVAVHFASRPGATTEGIVYFAPLRDLVRHGVKVYVPTPLYSRVLLQRGIFVQTADELPKRLFHTIRFPTGSAFPVYRNGIAENILPEPLWIGHLRDFCKRPDIDLASPTDRIIDLWFRSDLPKTITLHPAFNPVTQIAEWLDFYEDMRYWLTASMVGNREAFATDLLDAIRSSNPELVELHGQCVARLGKGY